MRKRIMATLAGTAVIGCLLAGTAHAAATPTARTGGAGDITGTSAVLHATVNPHGVGTDYTFNYGITPSYGTATVARTAGSGNRAVSIAERVGGLSPGTIYHFQIDAVSAAGSATGADVTFTTAGNPPSAVTTGAAVSVGKTHAQITGTIDPNGAATTWYVQYGLSTGYGVQNYPQTLPAGIVADPVGVTLSGLAPATLFHYRIIALHGATVTYGADGTFFTQPDHPPAAGLHATTSPGSRTRSPYRFTTSGTLGGGKYIPAAQRCSGTVAVSYKNGKHRLAYVVADVGSNCRFTAKGEFRHTAGHGKVHLDVVVSYRGNGYLAKGQTTDHVTVGR